MYRYRDDFGSDLGGSLVGIGLILCLIAAFLVIKATLFVIRTFVKYSDQHKSLWTSLVVCIACCIGSGLLYKLTAFGGSPTLCVIGIAELLITCLVVDLKNRDTFLPEKSGGLVHQILHNSWWSSEDTPVKLVDEQLAA